MSNRMTCTVREALRDAMSAPDFANSMSNPIHSGYQVMELHSILQHVPINKLPPSCLN